MNRKKQIIGVILLFLFVLLAPPIFSVYREVRQERLDHTLVEAIKSGNDNKALTALAEGANGEATDAGKPPTFREALLHLLDSFRHPGQKNEKSTLLPALLLHYQKANHDGSISGSDTALVRELLDHGARVNDRGKYGRSPLHYASRYSHGDTVRLLLARGADIEMADRYGSTPLMEANAEATPILLEHGASIELVDKTNSDKITALIFATMNGDPDKVRILLEHGAKTDVTDLHGNTAIDFAKANVKDYATPKAWKIISLLLQHGAK